MAAGRHFPPARRYVRGPAVLAAFVLIAGLIYYPSLNGPFILDDWGDIQANPAIRMTAVSPEALARAVRESPLKTRPTAYLSFALNYRIHEYRVAGYRLVNIALHVATAFLLYLFARTFLVAVAPAGAGGGGRVRPETAAFWGALLWLVHPVNTSSVNYVVQRMNGLGAMFFVLTLLLYLYARRADSRKRGAVWFAAAACSGLLGLGSRETCILLPCFILLLEAFLPAPDRRRKTYLLVAGLSALILVLPAAFLVADGSPVRKILQIRESRDFTAGQGVLTSGRAAVYYLGLLAWPRPCRLNPDHVYPLSSSLLAPVTTLSSAAALLCLAVFAVRIASRNRLASLALIWFLGNLAIESSGLPNETMFEYRVYLPGMLLFPALAAALARGVQGAGRTAALLGLAALVLSLWTLDRNHVWSDSPTLWRDAAAKSPSSARVLGNYGKALLDEGRTGPAKHLLYRSLGNDPGHAPAHNNLAVILAKEGDFSRALEHLQVVVRLQPRNALARMNLGMALHRAGRLDAAAAVLALALESAPDDARVHLALADCLADARDTEAALRHYRIALRLQPDFAAAHHNLGVLLARTGRPDGAVRHFTAALALSPGDPEILSHLRRARREAGPENP